MGILWLLYLFLLHRSDPQWSWTMLKAFTLCAFLMIYLSSIQYSTWQK
jgi:hypothetical protein